MHAGRDIFASLLPSRCHTSRIQKCGRGEVSSDEGTRMEAPKAPPGMRSGEGSPLPSGGGVWRGAVH